MTGVRQLGNRVQSSVTGEGVHCKFKTYNDQKEKRSDKVIKPTRYGRKRRVPGVSGCAVGPRREPWGNTFPSSPKLDPPHAKLGGGDVGDERRNRGCAASCRVENCACEILIEGAVRHYDMSQKAGHQAVRLGIIKRQLQCI